MRAKFVSGLTTIAAVAAALSLAACDQRSPGGDTVSKRSDMPPTAADTSQKMAAAGDKAAMAVDDSGVTAKVKAALLAEPGLRSLQIGVETKNGTVTLSGSVDSDTSRERAKQVASSVGGVSGVVDQLTVKS